MNHIKKRIRKGVQPSLPESQTVPAEGSSVTHTESPAPASQEKPEIENWLAAKCVGCAKLVPSLHSGAIYFDFEVRVTDSYVDCQYREVCDYLEKKFGGKQT